MKTVKEYQDMVIKAANINANLKEEITFLKECMNKLKADNNRMREYCVKTKEFENLYKNALRENRLLKEKYENN